MPRFLLLYNLQCFIVLLNTPSPLFVPLLLLACRKISSLTVLLAVLTFFHCCSCIPYPKPPFHIDQEAEDFVNRYYGVVSLAEDGLPAALALAAVPSTSSCPPPPDWYTQALDYTVYILQYGMGVNVEAHYVSLSHAASQAVQSAVAAGEQLFPLGFASAVQAEVDARLVAAELAASIHIGWTAAPAATPAVAPTAPGGKTNPQAPAATTEVIDLVSGDDEAAPPLANPGPQAMPTLVDDAIEEVNDSEDEDDSAVIDNEAPGIPETTNQAGRTSTRVSCEITPLLKLYYYVVDL